VPDTQYRNKAYTIKKVNAMLDGEKELIDHTRRKLEALTQGKGVYHVRWRLKDGNGKLFRITIIRQGRVYIRWEAYGAYPPKGIEQWRHIGIFYNEWEPVL